MVTSPSASASAVGLPYALDGSIPLVAHAPGQCEVHGNKWKSFIASWDPQMPQAIRAAPGELAELP